jgi:hypothetical protein
MPKTKGSMRGSRGDGLRALLEPPQRRRGRRPLLSWSPQETMRKGRMRKRGI